MIKKQKNSNFSFSKYSIDRSIKLVSGLLYFILLFQFASVISKPKVIEESDIPIVKFTEKEPIIDGILDDHLQDLIAYQFPQFFRLGNPKTDKVEVTYRVAYTPTHIYFYFETDADSISYHKLGNLWGDGYKILLGAAQENGKTNEYYDLAFSPSKDDNYWARQRVAAYNFSQPYIPLSKSTQSQEKDLGDRTGFEVMIAWEDIYPYHPWFNANIGYNIYFAKGFYLPKNGYFPNGYAVVKDEGIWNEERPKRNYAPLLFEVPDKLNEGNLLLSPNKLNYRSGENTIVNIIYADNYLKGKAFIQLLDSSNNEVLVEPIILKKSEGLNKITLELNTGDLPSSTYTLKLKGACCGEKVISILPTIPFEEIENDLLNEESKLSGLRNTLAFHFLNLKKMIAELKPYESGKKVLEKWREFSDDYQQFINGQDPYAYIKTPYRRAFKSKYDDSYQPYTINLPDDYNPDKKYPLLVFLHGSGRDEVGLLNRARSNGQFIELAPFGRDKFRAYADDYSQKDILEAVEDVIKHFSVDKNKIIVGGFSMGGYGALRTFYEKPDLFKGVAVFAGHPNLASEWLRRKHPNFRKQKYLKDFKGVPVFIYHGEKDASLSINTAKDLDRDLRAAGAEVTTRFIEDKAHEYQDDKTNEIYHKWLTDILNK